jgi:hypothetical protein
MNDQDKEIVEAKMKSILQMSAGDREAFIAQTIGDVYDLELPVPDVVEALSDVRRADPGEHVYYLVPENITKELFTLTSNCEVTQEKVTPSTRQELTFTDLISKEYYVCIHDWIKGDHDVIGFYADAIMEAMNRQEDYAILQLVDAGAVSTGKVFALDSGKAEFDYPKLIEMRKAVKKYGRKLVLISGANVTEDIDLMDFNQDTQRPFTIDKVVDQWISIEDCEVDVDSGTVKVIDPDIAYLVAVEDSAKKKPILFSRRKLDPIAGASDTTLVAKERAVIDTGNMITTDDPKRKFARGKAGYQEYGAVLLNAEVCAKFDKTP